MQKTIVILLGTLLVLSGCNNISSNEASGAYAGANIGHVLGSAVGGLTGGAKGSYKGRIIGMVGGAIAGAAVGKAVDNNKRMDKVRPRQDSQENDDVYGTNGMATTNASARAAEPQPDYVHVSTPLQIRNVQLSDANGDGILVRGEECTLTFEVMNNNAAPVFNIQPTIEETTGNKHVSLSPNLLVERIAPHKGIRYTSSVLADKRLKDGEIKLKITVIGDDRQILATTDELVIPTKKKTE